MNPSGQTSPVYKQQQETQMQCPPSIPHGMIPVPTHVMMPYYPSLPPYMEQLPTEQNSSYNMPVPISPEQYSYPPPHESHSYPPQCYEYNTPASVHNDGCNPNSDLHINPYPYDTVYHVPYNTPYNHQVEDESLNTCYGPGPSISTSCDRIRGPEGCNLFVFHLPNEMTNWDLYQLFKRFGNLLSVHTMINPRTGLSRGFGFVSYDTPDAVDDAIVAMNGFRLGKKRLKVQRKREDEYPPIKSEKKTIPIEIEEEKEGPLTDTELSEQNDIILETTKQAAEDEENVEGMNDIVHTIQTIL